MKRLTPAVKHRLILYFKVLVLVPLCVFMVLVPYSILLRWNLITSILFWFFIIPGVTLYLHSRLFETSHLTWKAVASLASFYGIMVYMIYEHYQSDQFAIMMFSAAYNFLVIVVVFWVQRADKVYNR